MLLYREPLMSEVGLDPIWFMSDFADLWMTTMIGRSKCFADRCASSTAYAASNWWSYILSSRRRRAAAVAGASKCSLGAAASVPYAAYIMHHVIDPRCTEGIRRHLDAAICGISGCLCCQPTQRNMSYRHRLAAICGLPFRATKTLSVCLVGPVAVCIA